MTSIIANNAPDHRQTRNRHLP